MKELTINQLKNSLENISQSILYVPDNLIVHKDYLGNLSNQEFLIAYKEYRDIITEFFLEASIYPMEYGYSNISRKTGEETYKNLSYFL